VYRIYFARCMNIFNLLLAQLVKYDVHTTRKINSIQAIFNHILSLYCELGQWTHYQNNTTISNINKLQNHKFRKSSAYKDAITRQLKNNTLIYWNNGLCTFTRKILYNFAQGNIQTI